MTRAIAVALAAAVSVGPVAAAPQWWSIAGSAMRANGADVESEYIGPGCISHNSTSPAVDWHFDADVQLESGATATGLSLEFDDIDPDHDVSATLYVADGFGGIAALASVSSSGAPGAGSAQTFFVHPVNNAAENLIVRLDLNAGTNGLLQGCRVAVRFEAAADTIFTDGFESGDTGAWDTTSP